MEPAPPTHDPARTVLLVALAVVILGVFALIALAL
jgi:hypothetical protein